MSHPGYMIREVGKLQNRILDIRDQVSRTSFATESVSLYKSLRFYILKIEGLDSIITVIRYFCNSVLLLKQKNPTLIELLFTYNGYILLFFWVLLTLCGRRISYSYSSISTYLYLSMNIFPTFSKLHLDYIKSETVFFALFLFSTIHILLTSKR